MGFVTLAPIPKSVTDRLLSRTEKDPSGCWLWKGHLNSWGYGRFWLSGRKSTAVWDMVHRVSYETFLDKKIPAGLEIDHLCRVRNCINPEHLEPVTPRENTFRSNSRHGINARKTVCLRGHSLAGDNLVKSDKNRRCRTCTNDAQRAKYHERKNAQ